MGREDEIRIIAHSMWQEEHCCHGRDVEHWLKAEAIWEKRQKKEAKSKNAQPRPKGIMRGSRKSRAVRKRQ